MSMLASLRIAGPFALAVLVFAHLGAGPAAAVPAPFVQEVECNVTEPVCILVVPDGSGSSFSQARTFGGDVVDATVAVLIWLVDEFGGGGPLAGFEAEYLTLLAPGGGTVGCAQPYVAAADHDTDDNGWTEFSLAPRAGGWSQGLLEIYLIAELASAMGSDIPPLPIYFNSPDLNGDLVIDLTDIALFSQDLHESDAPLRSDLVWDGVINLSDITVFCQHLGASCP